MRAWPRRAAGRTSSGLLERWAALREFSNGQSNTATPAASCGNFLLFSRGLLDAAGDCFAHAQKRTCLLSFELVLSCLSTLNLCRHSSTGFRAE